MTSEDDQRNQNPEINYFFQISKIITFLVFNYLDNMHKSVILKIIGTNIRFIVRLSEKMIKHSIEPFRLEVLSFRQVW